MADLMLQAFLRPLSLIPLESEVPSLPIPQANAGNDEDVVFELLDRQLSCSAPELLSRMRARCSAVSLRDQEPIAVPHHPVIMEHVIHPLREAKLCYVLGMPIACIAQAGLVGEMIAIWRFQMVAPTVNAGLPSKDMQQLLFGREFDRLGQERRIAVLKAFSDVDNELYRIFDELRTIRNKYLHMMHKQVEGEVDSDAKDAYQHACILLSKTLNGTLDDQGRFLFPPRVLEFVREIIRRAGAADDSTHCMGGKT